MELPSEARFSPDGEFLAVTCYNGAVHLFRMPPIIDPMQVEARGSPAPESMIDGTKDSKSGTPAPIQDKRA